MVTLYVAEGVLTEMTGTVLLSYRESSVVSSPFSVFSESQVAILAISFSVTGFQFSVRAQFVVPLTRQLTTDN